MKNISFASNKWGYIVQVCEGNNVIHEYTAGNCLHDSTVTVPLDSSSVVNATTLLRYARQTAADLAQEFGVDKTKVAYDSDLTQFINPFTCKKSGV
jgi:hypothetical protein